MTTQFDLTGDRGAQSSVPLHPLIAARWSPRAFDPTAVVAEDALRALFESARWAASFRNNQPARFIVGRRGDDTFGRILDALVAGNRKWAHAASALAVGLVVTVEDNGEPMDYAEYGVGLATQNLVVQAMAQGLVCHQMAGFSPDGIRRSFAVPDGVEPLVVTAIGRLAEPGTVAPELHERDALPRERRGLHEIVFRAGWGNPAF